MKRNTLKRLGAAFLAAAMVLQSFGGMAGVSAAESSQMSSEKEVVYANVYSDAVREQDFDANWKFYLGSASGAEASNFDDSAWENVSLPHDYSIEQEYTSAGEAESGYLLGGTGWYRKHFSLDPDVEGKTIRIDFGGVYMNATIWVNGTKLGTHPYGYTPFSFDITDYVTFDGENVITVKVDHQTPSSRWYSGSGIYRSVKLTMMDEVHVDLYGTQISTPNLEAEQGGKVNMTVKTTVANDGAAAKDVVLVHTIYEKGTENSIGTVTTAAQSVKAGESKEIEATLQANNPKLWNSWDKGEQNLYTVVTEVKVGANVVDTYETDYGFRYFKFDTHTGFYLNGEKLKLKGVCMHHDQGALGSEDHYRAIERQVEILMEMGCNSIRVTHNPASENLIKVCNEKGILLIEEVFDGWMYAKNGNRNDYSNWFATAIESGNQIIGADAEPMAASDNFLGKVNGLSWAQFDLTATIKRGYNAPSIFMWSLGNEIWEGAGGHAQFPAVARTMVAWATALDSTRPSTTGDNNLKGGPSGSPWSYEISEILSAVGGATGANYCNGSQYDVVYNQYKNTKGFALYGAETASHVNSRGVYNVTGSQAYNSDKALTSYDYSAVGWGATASSAWYDVITRDYVAGEYVWTGFDYMGEPTPSNGTGSGWVSGSNSPKNSFFGIIDTAGLPKDNYYFYQSQWNDEVTTLHVLPAWNRDVLQNPSNVPVVVYSDAASVKLTLTTTNGTVKDLGTKTFVEKTTAAGYTYQMASANSTNNRDLYLTWYVPFEEGTITATAYDKAGNVISETVGRSFVTTTGDEAKLDANVDRTEIKANGKDLAYVTIDVTDADGNIVPDAKNNVTINVEGDGVLVGMDNGKQSDHQSFQDDNRDAFSGSLIAIVQSTKEAGEFTVTATAAGLKSDSVKVKTVDAGVTGDISFLMSKNYYVQAGTAPELPSKIETTLADGTVEELKVKWNAIPADKYAQAGTFAVAGVVDGKYSVSVTVNVIDEVGGLLNYSAVTAVGSVPSLPATRQVVMLDGTILDAAFAVNWEAMSAADFAEAGTVVVNGEANVFGTVVPVTATIRVEEASVSLGGNTADQLLRVTQDIPEDLQSDTLSAVVDGDAAIGANNDGDANETAWSNYDASQAGDNTAEIVFEYATQTRLKEIVVHFWKDGYAAEYPDAGTTKFFVSENGNDWTEIEVTETIGSEKDRVKPYTYSFDVATATFVKLVVTNSTAQKTAKTCTGITEVELNEAVIGGIEANSSTGLSALRVNGVEATQAELESGVFYTADTTAVVRAAGKDNAAVTVLPAYEGKVLVITEAEDHTAKSVYEIVLGQSKPSDPTSSSNDLPLTAMTYKTGSEQGQSGSEGPVRFAFDGDVSTFWHSEWSPSWSASQYQDYLWVEFDLKEATVVNGLRYLQRGGNGDITGYRIEGSVDGTTWTTLTTGTWNRTGDWVVASFAPTELVAVKFVATATYADSGNNRFASAKELRLTVPGAGSTDTVDKSVLTKVLAEAETYVEAAYEANSWAALEAAVAAAEAVKADADATQEEVNAAVAAVDAAILALEKLFDVVIPDPTPTPGEKEDVSDIYPDIKDGAWYEVGVQFVYDAGLMSGSNGLFNPTSDITRAQIVTTLYRLAGEPDVTDTKALTDFTDVAEGKYYTDAVCWAYANGVATGNNGKFDPTGKLTRQQMAAFFFRYADVMDMDTTARGDYSSMVNADKVSGYAEDAMAWAAGEGLISGSDVTVNGVAAKDLNPRGNTTRAQVATILMRFCAE